MKSTNATVQKTKKLNASGNINAVMAATYAEHDVAPAQRNEMIAVAAYYRAQQRGFAPGSELDDWIQAEAEFEAIGNSPAN